MFILVATISAFTLLSSPRTASAQSIDRNTPSYERPVTDEAPLTDLLNDPDEDEKTSSENNSILFVGIGGAALAILTISGTAIYIVKKRSNKRNVRKS